MLLNYFLEVHGYVCIKELEDNLDEDLVDELVKVSDQELLHNCDNKVIQKKPKASFILHNF